MVANRRVQGGLGIVQRAQARFQLVSCTDQGGNGIVQFPLAGLPTAVTDPQSLLEEGAQAGVHRLLGFHLARGGHIGAYRHDGMRTLEAVAAILQIGFESVGVVHQALQGTVPSTDALVPEHPGAAKDG
jgi:hypothetical protein